jgi:hypothetical protein
MSVIAPADADPRKTVAAIRQLAEGRFNAVGTVTLVVRHGRRAGCHAGRGEVNDDLE